MTTQPNRDLALASSTSGLVLAPEGQPSTQAYSGAPSPPTHAPDLTARDGRERLDAEWTAPLPFGAAPAPKRFGKYDILERIGSGGMGLVYKARDTVLDRFVALKTIRNGVLADQDEIDRFLIEGKAVARLQHRHIIRIYDFGEHEGVPYYVMELLTGGTLADKKAALSQADPREAAAILEKIAEAVQAAHAQGILHRDLKPSNILLDEQGEPKVSDFGLAKLLDDQGDLTQAGKALGTPAYMSPEQMAGLKETLGPATDVWGLGVILYEQLTSRRPFEGKTPDDSKKKILKEHPPAPRQLRPNLPRDLEAIILKCLEKDPSQRYGNARALADDLAAWRAGQPTQARPLTAGERTRRWAWKHQRQLLAGLVLALVTVGLAFAWHRSFQPEDQLDPNAWEKPLQEALKNHGAVTLVGPEGQTKGFRWIRGGDLCRASLDDTNNQKTLALSTGDFGMLELFADAPAQGFVLEAEIFHVSTNESSGEVGLFLGNSLCQVNKQGGPGRRWFKFSFNDVGVLRNKEEPTFMYFGMRLFTDDALPADNSMASIRPKHFPNNQWNQFKLEATPKTITGYCNGNQAARWDVETLVENTKTILKSRARVDPILPHLDPALFQFDIGGGVGLVIQSGTALVKNVTLKSIPQPQQP